MLRYAHPPHRELRFSSLVDNLLCVWESLMIRQCFTFFSLLFLLLVSACSQVGSPVVEEGPTITDFSASPLNADGSATLSWRAGGRDLFVY